MSLKRRPCDCSHEELITFAEEVLILLYGATAADLVGRDDDEDEDEDGDDASPDDTTYVSLDPDAEYDSTDAMDEIIGKLDVLGLIPEEIVPFSALFKEKTDGPVAEG